MTTPLWSDARTPLYRRGAVSKRQDAVIVGGLLGDLHIQKTSATTERCRLRICHSMAQREYVDWKHEVLRGPFCARTKPPFETARPGEYLFYTMYMDQFLPYRSEWYMRGELGFRKVVPSNIGDLLVDPISLAVWYLDDGSKRSDCAACRLATQGFTLEENMALVECLRSNFGIEAKVGTWRRAGGELYGLSLPSSPSGYKRLKSLIYPLVEAEIPSMLYKLQ